MTFKGILNEFYTITNQLRSSVATFINALVAAKIAPNCDVESPLAPIPTAPAAPRVRSVRFFKQRQAQKFNPSSPPNGLPKTRRQALLEARAKARAPEAKTPLTRRTTPQFATRGFPATRRVVFSNWVRVQEYNPMAAPKRIQATRHRVCFE
ncbi:hypothetical protein FRC03_005895 [Tulasnella sp. 419]|nr:hypothetical protein FRC03_005895 [Tulasnella sp. 419]